MSRDKKEINDEVDRALEFGEEFYEKDSKELSENAEYDSCDVKPKEQEKQLSELEKEDCELEKEKRKSKSKVEEIKLDEMKRNSEDKIRKMKLENEKLPYPFLAMRNREISWPSDFISYEPRKFEHDEYMFNEIINSKNWI